ncbi:MAG TPA: Rieske (2Fe-2S) protein [Longimicrobiaceae bacterium]|nr:Rieske (2Fe-2S) protein [Longimicrobiaceae bacterium]
MLAHAIEKNVGDNPALEELGTNVARAVHGAVLDGGEPARNAADLLHGTWLGHPLHPMLTDVTIGAWLFGGMFDLMGLRKGDEASRVAGDRLAAIGTLSAIPTAVTGLADFSTVQKPAASTATVHAALNAVSVALYGLSLRDRRRGRRRRGLLLSGSAIALSSAAAWLGGHLVYAHKVGVDHAERFSGPDEWKPVLDAAELPEGTPRCAELDGKRVLLYREGLEIYAIGAVCSHAGGPLEEGDFDGHRVQCPWHQSVFDLRDGTVVHGPSTRPQSVFDARVRDGKVEVRLRES